MIFQNCRPSLRGAIFTSLLMSSSASFASNDAMVELLQVLRDNGTISEEAYSVLENSVQADQEKTDAKINEVAEEKVAKVNAISDKLKWAEKIKLKGDVRLRHEYQDRELGIDAESNTRSRYRYRVRLGAEADVNDSIKAGVGLASGSAGSSSARSTNQDLDQNFGSKEINLDYAFLEWTANEHFKVVGGKFKRKPYLWATTDLLWDGDINPEGVSSNIQFENSLGTTYGNVGYWILDEVDSSSSNGDSDDVSLSYFQLGQKFKHDNLFGNVAAIYYNFDNLSDASGDVNFDTTRVNDLDSWGLSGEIGFKDAFIAGKQVSFFADYINNMESDVDEDTGFALGFKYGDKKVKKRHDWQVKYIYADLEQDAFLAAYPDSDRFGGDTGVESHEISLKYGLAKNLYLGLDYYDSEIDRDSNNTPDLDGNEEQLFQIDLVSKF